MDSDEAHFRIRIPAPLKARIQKAAGENNRSMTAEIVSRLERSFDIVPEWEEAIENVKELWGKVEALESRVADHDEELYPSRHFRD